MNIEDVINQFENSGPSKYYSFETFVLNLLNNHLKKQGKSIEPIMDRKLVGDAIAKDGFDELQGFTIIEISIDIKLEKIDMIINKVLQNINSENNLSIKNQ
jgi:hypothetical protein